MKSKLKEVELNKEFPCLMEHKLCGEDSTGVYFVNHFPLNENSKKYIVCLVKTPGQDKIAESRMYFKPDLDKKEWFFLPKGTEITLTN